MRSAVLGLLCVVLCLTLASCAAPKKATTPPTPTATAPATTPPTLPTPTPLAPSPGTAASTPASSTEVGLDGTPPSVRTLRGHTSFARAVAFSPDGKLLATGAADHTVKLWDVAAGNLLRTLSSDGYTLTNLFPSRSEPYKFWSVAFSPDGKLLATGSDDDMVRVWDVVTGSLLRTLSGHTSYVYSVSFSPDGKLLASGTGKTIRLWDVATGSLVRTLTGDINSVRSVAFSPDGKLLAEGGDGKVKLWSVATGNETLTLDCYPHSLSYHPITFTKFSLTIVSSASTIEE